MVFRVFGRKRGHGPSGVDAIIAEIEARTGSATRPKSLPAWALVLRSPFETRDDRPTSWLGGVPRAPRSFRWPRGANGEPLHFIAQIDLSALAPEPTTGARPPGLPRRGALLVFIGQHYAIHVLGEADLADAAPVEAPRDLADVTELGYWGSGNTFKAWAVDPIAYLSRGEQSPEVLPDSFETPTRWITNWGIAALEADILVEALELELRLGREFVTYRRKQVAEGKTPLMARHIEERLAHCAMMEDHAPGLLAELQDWHATAAAQPPEAPIEGKALEAILARRSVLAGRMQNDYGARKLLSGSASRCWDKVAGNLPMIGGHPDFSGVPAAYRPLVDARITGWRGHRLFGIEPELPNNAEDLRGQDPLISIASDALIGTESEHDYGFSIWLDRERMARGVHEGGQLVRHCAV